MMNKILEVKNVAFSFNDSKILENISFELGRGEIISLIGRSGVGKTTLLELISGINKATQGQVLHYKGNYQNLSYLTQTPVLQIYRNALENASLVLDISDQLTEEKRNVLKQLFVDFNLFGSEAKFPNELSGGMKQRIGIIQTLVIDTNLYLFDEPFNAIDIHTLSAIQNKIWTLIKEKNAACIVVTHDIEQALLISDRVCIMTPSKGIVDVMLKKELVAMVPSDRKKAEIFSEQLFDLIKLYGALENEIVL